MIEVNKNTLAGTFATLRKKSCRMSHYEAWEISQNQGKEKGLALGQVLELLVAGEGIEPSTSRL